ncbi:unnamed protein product [Lepidochelys kempii]
MKSWKKVEGPEQGDDPAIGTKRQTQEKGRTEGAMFEPSKELSGEEDFPASDGAPHSLWIFLNYQDPIYLLLVVLWSHQSTISMDKTEKCSGGKLRQSGLPKVSQQVSSAAGNLTQVSLLLV